MDANCGKIVVSVLLDMVLYKKATLDGTVFSRTGNPEKAFPLMHPWLTMAFSNFAKRSKVSVELATSGSNESMQP